MPPRLRRNFDSGDSELARGANKWDTIPKRHMVAERGHVLVTCPFSGANRLPLSSGHVPHVCPSLTQTPESHYSSSSPCSPRRIRAKLPCCVQPVRPRPGIVFAPDRYRHHPHRNLAWRPETPRYEHRQTLWQLPTASLGVSTEPMASAKPVSAVKPLGLSVLSLLLGGLEVVIEDHLESCKALDF